MHQINFGALHTNLKKDNAPCSMFCGAHLHCPLPIPLNQCLRRKFAARPSQARGAPLQPHLRWWEPLPLRPPPRGGFPSQRVSYFLLEDPRLVLLQGPTALLVPTFACAEKKRSCSAHAFGEVVGNCLDRGATSSRVSQSCSDDGFKFEPWIQ